ncbi:glycosyltransferase [Candidatus Woesearchaeota archaeon]|nr:glycosyltransferase [Candidatus Woesearchaeota archaeon]
MRIAFFTDTFHPQINGIVTSVVAIAKKLADRGHSIYIIAPKFPKAEQFSYPNITVFRRPSVPALIYKDFKFTLPFDPWLMKFIMDEKVDIIHFHTPITLGLQAVLIAKLLSIPLVGSFHTFFADPHYLKHIRLNNKVMQRLAWKWSNSYYNRCDLVVCPSEGTRAELIAKKCRKPIKVIRYGIDLSMFDNAKSCSVKKAYNGSGKLLLFVGRIAHEKNLPYLLECFALVLKKVPSAKLVIVGDGPQMPELKAKIRAFGISQKVILTGQIKHEKLIKAGIFGACDVFVTTSTTETGPVSVLEAQANGLVCVGVKSRGMDVIKDDVNGYIIEPSDKSGFASSVVKLLTNEKEYARMKRATLKEIRKYDINNITKVWEQTYKELVNRKNQSKRRI